jgi:hypothetical protein
MFSYKQASATVVLAVVSCMCTPSFAYATPDDTALKGTYTVISDGQWAQTNESYHDEKSVTQTWTITSTCSSFLDCTGRVTSDQGWSADARYLSGVWRVVRTAENWEPCADGTAAPGEQSFQFWPDKGSPPNLTGWDKTIGPSGACGFNRWLTVTMPLKLIKIG